MKRREITKHFVLAAMLSSFFLFLNFNLNTGTNKVQAGEHKILGFPDRKDLPLLEQKINAYEVNKKYPDDPFVLLTVKEALKGAKERNGGIGACLVLESTGKILEQAHNCQYEPYFRSDLHAEMDLLNRYEERMRITRSRNPKDPTYRNPRNMKGIVLYTSVEPCPMCLTRIINSGIKEVRYAAVDETGGMATRFQDLPPFWKDLAEGISLKQAECSPELKTIARKLFRPMITEKTGFMK